MHINKLLMQNFRVDAFEVNHVTFVLNDADDNMHVCYGWIIF